MHSPHRRHGILRGVVIAAASCAPAIASQAGDSALDRFRSLATDADGDGVVSDAELIQALADRAASIPLIDADSDSDIDRDDAVAVMARFLAGLQGAGAEPDEAMLEAAEQIVRGAEAAASEDDPYEFHAEWVTRQYHDQHTTNERRPGGYPPNHDQALTAQWYQPPANHNKTASGKNWPPNHLFDVTKTWTPDVHNVDHSRHRWPPNHFQDMSVEWPMETPNSHSVVVSRTWPPNHFLAASRDMFPEHYKPISTFDPNSVVPRWNHEQYFTSQWTHGTSLSHARWPGSHYFQMSLTWEGHSMRLSIHWPPNHWMQTSQLWLPEGEPPTYPQDWPPNHSFSISKKWGDPPKLPPWFPGPDHSLWESAQDIIGGVVPGHQGGAHGAEGAESSSR